MKYKIKYKVLEIKENPEIYIGNPDNVFKVVKDDFSPIQENLLILGLNINNGVIYKKTIGLGSYNNLVIKPSDILRLLLLAGCDKYVIAHNHPSGDITPSKEDLIFTSKIKEASSLLCVELLDHIIYSGNSYYSMKKQNIL